MLILPRMDGGRNGGLIDAFAYSPLIETLESGEGRKEGEYSSRYVDALEGMA